MNGLKSCLIDAHPMKRLIQAAEFFIACLKKILLKNQIFKVIGVGGRTKNLNRASV